MPVGTNGCPHWGTWPPSAPLPPGHADSSGGDGPGPALAVKAQVTSGGPGAGSRGDLPPAADAGGAGPGSEAPSLAPPAARDDPSAVPCPQRMLLVEAVSRDRAKPEAFTTLEAPGVLPQAGDVR